jgi:MFS family permease
VSNTNPLRSFRERNVRIFFGGFAISGVGTWAQTTALILLVRDLGGGGLELGIVTACQFLPTLLIGLYAGAVADRVDRYRLTMRLQALAGLLAMVLAFLDFGGLVSIPLVFAMTALSGTLSAFDNPTRRTLATELVPATEMVNVLSLSTSVMTGARMFGPAIAAVVAAQIGTAWVFLANGVSFLVFLFAMASMDIGRFHRITPAARSATPIRDGLHEVWRIPSLRVTLVVFGVISTFAFNYLVGFPLLVADRLMRSDATFGWLLSTMSFGNVIGSLLVARQREVSAVWMYGSATALAASMTVVAISTNTLLTFVVVFPLGMAATGFVNSSTLLVQQRTNPQMRSRVLALTTVLFLGSTPIGGPITGAIGDVAGAVWANLYGALITFAAVAIGLPTRRYLLRRNPDQPSMVEAPGG